MSRSTGGWLPRPNASVRPQLEQFSEEQKQRSLEREQENTLSTGSAAPSVVLVHGGFVDGSGWQKGHNLLRRGGYNVSVVQNPTGRSEERRGGEEGRTRWSP